MRAKKAKELRKIVYGDMSQKQKEYKFFTTVKKVLTGKEEEEEKYKNVNKTTVVCTGLRMLYQEAKKEYKRR